MSKLIKCGDHKWVPMSIVCLHILDGTETEYVRLEAGPGLQDDFVCPACFALATCPSCWGKVGVWPDRFPKNFTPGRGRLLLIRQINSSAQPQLVFTPGTACLANLQLTCPSAKIMGGHPTL